MISRRCYDTAGPSGPGPRNWTGLICCPQDGCYRLISAENEIPQPTFTRSLSPCSRGLHPGIRPYGSIYSGHHSSPGTRSDGKIWFHTSTKPRPPGSFWVSLD
ncbi:unnamed protein product [Boreogadus saida]